MTERNWKQIELWIKVNVDEFISSCWNKVSLSLITVRGQISPSCFSDKIGNRLTRLLRFHKINVPTFNCFLILFEIIDLQAACKLKILTSNGLPFPFFALFYFSCFIWNALKKTWHLLNFNSWKWLLKKRFRIENITLVQSFFPYKLKISHWKLSNLKVLLRKKGGS